MSQNKKGQFPVTYPFQKNVLQVKTAFQNIMIIIEGVIFQCQDAKGLTLLKDIWHTSMYTD